MSIPIAERRKKRRAEITSIQEAMELPGSLITDFEQEGLTLNFNLTSGSIQSGVTLNIPEGYPDDGSFVCYDSYGQRNLGLASIKRIVHDLVVEFATLHNVPPVPTFPDEAPPVHAQEEPDTSTPWVPKGDPSGCKERLLQAVARYNSTVPKGTPKTGVCELATKDIIVRHPIWFGHLSHQTARIWGLDPKKWVVVEMQIAEPFYMRSRDRPKLRVFQSPDTDLSQRNVNTVSFGLQWMVQKRVERTMSWPIRDEDGGNPDDWLPALTKEVTDAVMNCNKTCVVCSKPLEYIGLKPAVCADPLCTFSHMQFGLGEDVISAIVSHPSVIDLLISLTSAAAGGDLTRFNPYPAGVEVTYKEEGMTSPNTISFLKGPNLDTDRDGERVRHAIDALPPVDMMSTFPESKKLQEMLDAKDRLSYPLLRWIISSCRAHLQPLEKDDQLSDMNTPYQYVFVSTPPEVEKKFNELKAEHGSILAWHGSSFSNWHSILRLGLKNFSGTKFQTHGTAYGNGVYLAADAATSLGYAHNVGGWDKSMMGKTTFQGLALCEIIDYKVGGTAQYKANPYYVIPDETHVLTRFFFVYPAGKSASIPAEKLRKQVDKLMAKLKAQD